MKVNTVFDRTIALMEDRLTLNARRQELIASNIANIDTPGYVAKDIPFENALEDAKKSHIRLVTSHEDHMNLPFPEDIISSQSSNVEVVKTGPVDLETEMSKLIRNNVEYQFIVTMLTKKFTLIKTALVEGGR